MKEIKGIVEQRRYQWGQWKQAKEGLFDKGVDAWWCDSCEPFTPEWSRKMKPEPSAMYGSMYPPATATVPSTTPVGVSPVI